MSESLFYSADFPVFGAIIYPDPLETFFPGSSEKMHFSKVLL